MSGYKILIDKKKCIGCGACTALLPDIFELESGKARAKKSEIDAPEKVKDAVEGCPVNAIKVVKK